MMQGNHEAAAKFYGLDGDKIGGVVESYIINAEIEALSVFSRNVSRALEEIEAEVLGHDGAVIFCAGDSILFKGRFDKAWCEGLLARFVAITGRTASLGVGASATDAYLALKLAKARGGGVAVQFPPPHP